MKSDCFRLVSVLIGNGNGYLFPKLDLSTQDGSRLALTKYTRSLGAISLERARINASLSRLEAATSNLAVASTTCDEARSRITDADIAEETAHLVRTRILQQATTAVLGQANQQPQSALELLRAG